MIATKDKDSISYNNAQPSHIERRTRCRWDLSNVSFQAFCQHCQKLMPPAHARKGRRLCGNCYFYAVGGGGGIRRSAEIAHGFASSPAAAGAFPFPCRNEKLGCQVGLVLAFFQLTAVHSGAATWREGFVKCFPTFPQAVGMYCSCHAAQESKGNIQKTNNKILSTSCRPRLCNSLFFNRCVFGCGAIVNTLN